MHLIYAVDFNFAYTDPAELTEERCKEIIASSEPTGKKRKRK